MTEVIYVTGMASLVYTGLLLQIREPSLALEPCIYTCIIITRLLIDVWRDYLTVPTEKR